MSLPGRPTLRCLQKLATLEGWDDAHHQRMVLAGVIDVPVSALAHPLVEKVAEVFPQWSCRDDAHDSIKGLSNPVWWKARRDKRWRGAVWEDPVTGQAWLCDAGIRRAGQGTDFYASFMAAVGADGAAALMPTDEDRALLQRELTESALRQWEHQACVDAIETAIRATNEGIASLAIFSPDGRLLCDVVIVAEVLRDSVPDGASVDLVIEIEWKDWARIAALEWVASLIQTSINPFEQDWHTHEIGGRPTFSIVMLLAALHAAPTRIDMQATDGQLGSSIPGAWAHRVVGREIVNNLIEGRAMRALCGTWFVPRQDWQSKPVCPTCELVYASL